MNLPQEVKSAPRGISACHRRYSTWLCSMSLKNEIRALADDELRKFLQSAAPGTTNKKLALLEYQRRLRGCRMKRKLVCIMRRLVKTITSFRQRTRPTQP